MSTVRAAYEHELAQRGYASDPGQLAAVAALERCVQEWADYRARRSNALILCKTAFPLFGPHDHLIAVLFKN